MNIKFENINLPVTICATPDKIQTGIQGLDSLNGEGYLFFLSKGEHSFWMKDCLISIDIIFINDGKVTEIFENCPPCSEEPCERYTSFGDMVLEVESGFCKLNNIKKGEPVRILP